MGALGAVRPAAQAARARGGRAQGRAGPGGARQGKNDFHQLGYGGPSPPPGSAQRHAFRIYALDCELELGAGAALAARRRDCRARARVGCASWGRTAGEWMRRSTTGGQPDPPPARLRTAGMSYALDSSRR
ncbi:MAG: hypothetical protein U1E76_17440 [Planctomycetota bacterium]